MNQTHLQGQDPNAALALVSARPEGNSTDRSPKSSQNSTTNEDDADLKRAKDLLELHATFKVAHPDGSNPGLNEAREAVERVLRTMR